MEPAGTFIIGRETEQQRNQETKGERREREPEFKEEEKKEKLLAWMGPGDINSIPSRATN